MVTFSIIIINYNVKYFLEQCLFSVKKAIERINAEVLVIDNHSSDGSIPYLEARFSWVRFISCETNHGFAKANNAALRYATGKYILFLNPDTIVAEDSIEKCISFFESTQDAGALGVKMIDGSGSYLKESKRGFPSPWVSICKLSGLTALFPHTGLFARYYLGHLDPGNNQAIDVVSGAFFCVRKETLDKTGGFDEQFFMYAEDIDLSYRIQLAGFTNYYLAATTIIHFKGESTPKDARYIKQFYKAMSQFVKKHFSGGKARGFAVIMDAAIWFRAGFSLLGKVFTSTKTVPIPQEKYFLQGDAQSVSALRSALGADHSMIAGDKNQATGIILCEGPDFSFSEIIETMGKRSSAGIGYKIYAAHSGSIVGSDSKNKSGQVIPV